MEHTGPYWRPVPLVLVNAGFFVSVVEAMLIQDYHAGSLCCGRTEMMWNICYHVLKLSHYQAVEIVQGEEVSATPDDRQHVSSVLTQSQIISAITEGKDGVLVCFDSVRYSALQHMRENNQLCMLPLPFVDLLLSWVPETKKYNGKQKTY